MRFFRKTASIFNRSSGNFRIALPAARGDEQERRQKHLVLGFTLIELLVVVSIIAILLTLLFPALNLARWKANNGKCVSNLKELYFGFMGFATDNGGFWPYRPDVPFNNFQRGEINDQPRPDGFSNAWGNSGYTLVSQVAPYFGYTYPYGQPYRQTVMYDDAALGPTFVCPQYEPTLGGSGRSKHGTHDRGLVDTNGGGNDVHYMSYNFYAMGGSWRERFRKVVRVGQRTDFGMIYRGNEYLDLPKSNLLFGDMVLRGTGPYDPVKILHKPPPDQGTTVGGYVTNANHLSRINQYFNIYGNFVQNNAYMDGAVRTVKGNSFKYRDTHVRLRSQDLIPLP